MCWESQVFIIGGSHGDSVTRLIQNKTQFRCYPKMTLFTIHSVAVQKESQASLFYSVCLLVTLFGPLFVAYSSQGFWVKSQVHKEMPIVRFKHQALVILYTAESERPLTWSTYNGYNQLMNAHLRQPSVTVS